MNDNTLLESAGLYGESEIHYVNLSDMSVSQVHKMDGKYFAEGCDLIEDETGKKTIYQLTWQENTMYCIFSADVLSFV